MSVYLLSPFKIVCSVEMEIFSLEVSLIGNCNVEIFNFNFVS